MSSTAEPTAGSTGAVIDDIGDQLITVLFTTSVFLLLLDATVLCPVTAPITSFLSSEGPLWFHVEALLSGGWGVGRV